MFFADQSHRLTANDCAHRDPASWALYGGHGANFVLCSVPTAQPPDARFTAYPRVDLVRAVDKTLQADEVVEAAEATEEPCPTGVYGSGTFGVVTSVKSSLCLIRGLAQSHPDVAGTMTASLLRQLAQLPRLLSITLQDRVGGASVVAAVFGDVNVTPIVRSHVLNGALSVDASEAALGKPMPGLQKKALTVVYRDAEGGIKVRVAKEGEKIENLKLALVDGPGAVPPTTGVVTQVRKYTPLHRLEIVL